MSSDPRMAGFWRVLFVVALGAHLSCTATTSGQNNTTTPTRSTITAPTRSTTTASTRSDTTAPPQGVITASSQSDKLSPYSDCPLSQLSGCTCVEDPEGPIITVTSGTDDIDSCLDSLTNSGYTTFYKLSVENQDSISLTENYLGLLQFNVIYFNSTPIDALDENFLGTSRNFTQEIEFKYCDLPVFPKMYAELLISLTVEATAEQVELITSLNRNTFVGTPALEEFVIFIDEDLTFPRDVFRPLTKLRTVDLGCSTHLQFGGGHFASPDLKQLTIGQKSSSRVELDPGSLSGIPAGAEISLKGDYIGGWQPLKFFNIFRGGVTLNVLPTEQCGCDLAWIRYSGFLSQVTMNCATEEYDIPLSQYDLSGCSFHQHQFLHITEL